jgi:hypothetical protein
MVNGISGCKALLQRLALAITCCSIASVVFADPYYYTVWTSANPAGGTAQGVITLPDSSTVTVNFTALNADGSPGNFLGGYTTGTSTWSGWSDYSSDYLSSQVSTIPAPYMLQLVGGQDETYIVTLSAPIVGPLMDIVSLGAAGTNTQYDFNAPFTILSQGYDYWGGCMTCLTQSGDDLIGNEGSGAIVFNGTYSTFSWTVPIGEDWHGFTFGIMTTEALQQSGVPEPGSLALFGIGLLGVGAFIRGRRAGGVKLTPLFRRCRLFLFGADPAFLAAQQVTDVLPMAVSQQQAHYGDGQQLQYEGQFVNPEQKAEVERRE